MPVSFPSQFAGSSTAELFCFLNVRWVGIISKLIILVFFVHDIIIGFNCIYAITVQWCLYKSPLFRTSEFAKNWSKKNSAQFLQQHIQILFHLSPSPKMVSCHSPTCTTIWKWTTRVAPELNAQLIPKIAFITDAVVYPFRIFEWMSYCHHKVCQNNGNKIFENNVMVNS